LEKTQLRFYSHNAHSWLNSDCLGEDGHHNSPGTEEKQLVRKHQSGVDKKIINKERKALDTKQFFGGWNDEKTKFFDS